MTRRSINPSESRLFISFEPVEERQLLLEQRKLAVLERIATALESFLEAAAHAPGSDKFAEAAASYAAAAAKVETSKSLSSKSSNSAEQTTS